jgi:RNA polymerase sigma-B factor
MDVERFFEYRRTRDRRLRNELVEEHRGLATHLARRFADRGEPLDDLVQVAMVGLLKAVERFQPERGLAFSSFATPTILGEIKRHFRDRTWAIRVPRRSQELRLALRDAVERLQHDLGRTPRIAEVAECLDVEVEDVIDAMAAADAYRTTSFSAVAGGVRTVEERLGDDPSDTIERDVMLRQLIDALPDRERTIMQLRFYEDRTQSEIAEVVGISQMHVSRLLRKTLADLREQIDTPSR